MSGLNGLNLQPVNQRTRLLIFIVAVILLLPISGLTFQSISYSRDLEQFPPPGRLIDVGGYRLHLYCTGASVNGSPTVILESGVGASSLMWSLVQPGIAAYTRVCSYDRAGYGWSESGTMPRTADRLMDELYELLTVAGEQPPYVLVGHSFGGILNRVFASKHPADVAGIILVDARHEDYFVRMPPEYLERDEANLDRARWLRLLTPLGITRLAGNAGRLDTFEIFLAPLPAEIEATAWAMQIYNPNHWATSVAEREAIDESYRQVKSTQLPANLSLIVLTAENGVEAWQAEDEATNDATQEAWVELQVELTRLNSNSQWITVKDSGHYVYFDQPQAIVDAVHAMIDN